jgi:uncharacterized protein YyaL (SSP411 family)
MLKKTLYLIVFTFFFQVSYAQLNTYEFEQLDSLQLQEKRPVFVLVHTKWCKYCAAMLHHIYKDEGVVNSLNSFYYLVLFDAENRREITFKKQVYKYQPNGLTNGINALTLKLFDHSGIISYPSTIILNPNLEVKYRFDGYLVPKKLKSLLNDFKGELAY